jgi:hypothetical protein
LFDVKTRLPLIAVAFAILLTATGCSEKEAITDQPPKPVLSSSQEAAKPARVTATAEGSTLVVRGKTNELAGNARSSQPSSSRESLAQIKLLSAENKWTEALALSERIQTEQLSAEELAWLQSLRQKGQEKVQSSSLDSKPRSSSTNN